MAELSLWDEVLNTRPPEVEDYSVRRRLPLGILDMMHRGWSAYGPGDGNAHYHIRVLEHRRLGLVPLLRGRHTSLLATASREDATDEDYQTVKETFTAEFLAGELVRIAGNAFKPNLIMGGDASPAGIMVEPSAMSREEAIEGFRLTMLEARFS
jgi:hypothetical protein